MAEETAEFKTLIKKRGGIKSRLTLFTQYLNTVKQKLFDKTIQSQDYIELETRINQQELLAQSFDETQSEIEMLSDNLEVQIQERQNFEDTYFKIVAEAKQILSDNVQQSPGVDVGSIHSIQSQSHENTSVNIKLPQINLPKFSGVFEEWVEFRDMFESLIHKNGNLDNVQKFHYLRSSLQGDAKQIIHSIEVSSQNYEVAWGLLCDRYNNQRLLIFNHLHALHKLPIISRESPSDLRKLIDNTSKHLRALQALDLPTEHWDIIIIFWLTMKLDRATEREWEESRVTNEVPTLEEFKLFLKNKADILETVSINRSDQKSVINKNVTRKSFVATKNRIMCIFCNGPHYTNQCNTFLNLSVPERIEEIKKRKVCFNCLKSGHMSNNCPSSTCRKCNLKHHTLLHKEKQTLRPAETASQVYTSSSAQDDSNSSDVAENPRVTMVSYYNNIVLLPTAVLKIMDSSGNHQTCRALLDSGSQSHFVTSTLCDKLGLPRSKLNLKIMGITQSSYNISEKCRAEVKSCHSNFTISITCLVTHEICQNLPSTEIDISNLNIPSSLKLADPYFDKPGSIDLLIGAEVFYQLLCQGQLVLGNNRPILQNTRLGWVISGPLSGTSSVRLCHLCTNSEIQSQLQRFWELEECDAPDSSISSLNEKECESNFLITTRRKPNGKFVVTIPLKESPNKLGDSRQTAEGQFKSLEIKFQKNCQFKEMYVEFMREYIRLGHMSLRTNCDLPEYFLPHHGILNEKKVTTKLRVVFNGSSKTDTGWSLNDIQRVGPTIQDDLVSIVLRFRTHRYVLCADIEKMYRMVEIDPSQRSLQCIFWREDPSHELKTYTLNTVTYGTASAPFLAVRCLIQLSIDFKDTHPTASAIIANDFYVDDLLTGAESLSKATEIASTMSSILKSGGFQLRKWISNSDEILESIHSSSPADDAVLIGNKDCPNKTLGLYWTPKEDVLMYRIGELRPLLKTTKRVILSDISQIFDPLGLLSPSIIIAKIILQNLWRKRLSWDDTVPTDIETAWSNFRNQLPHLNSLKIQRLVLCDSSVSIQIHGFCDASLEAYGACLYARCVDGGNNVSVNLLTAKSKVSPLKVLTIPRLELSGALTLAKLLKKVLSSLHCSIESIHLWSDSTIVLHWLALESSQLQTFVGNRVSQIQTLTDIKDWRHVTSDNNPADIVSRGMLPSNLPMSSMWWHGPDWLSLPMDRWPESRAFQPTEIPEIKQVTSLVAIPTNFEFPFQRFSSFTHLTRTVAWCFRFAFNCKHPHNRRKSPLTLAEVKVASSSLFKIVQRESFPKELSAIRKNKPLIGSLASLSPFIDSEGLLRVGGRLQFSHFSYDKRHPIILSCKHYVTKLLFECEHIRLLHCGPQLLLASLRDRYWPIAGRNLSRQTCHKCVRCFRAKPNQMHPLMGMLPRDRVTPMPPFFVTGVDYAGPFLIKDKKGRGSKPMKAYLCLFICFSVKAVHLELVTELTSDAFIAMFRRFVSRRGRPRDIYSDNGTNFVGANTELKEFSKFIKINHVELEARVQNEGVTWHFIPSRSPHMGGLWEAGVKSCKWHLKRVMGNALLTYEDFYTLLTQVEAILNSRPLTPLSPDPNDLDVLTPAHFIIGRRLTSLPDTDLTDTNEGRLSRFQRLQALQQHFWKRWSCEYVNELQLRTKWKTKQKELAVGALVIIRDDNRHPLSWCLGRIVSLHPGKDGISRVATVRTTQNTCKLAYAKLCPLPLEQ